MTLLLIATLALVAAAAAAVAVVRPRLGARIARELAGHSQLRRRMTNLVGRGAGASERGVAVAATTMPGWVWFAWSRHPGQACTEVSGWAPTRWWARRRLAAARGPRPATTVPTHVPIRPVRRPRR